MREMGYFPQVKHLPLFPTIHRCQLWSSKELGGRLRLRQDPQVYRLRLGHEAATQALWQLGHILNP